MKQNEIFIVLTETGTLFSQTIKWFTKAPLNHASLSFDGELKEVYSFGRKKVNNPFVGDSLKKILTIPSTMAQAARSIAVRSKIMIT